MIAYVGYLSCTTQWPLQPIQYCKTLTPFLEPCEDKVDMIGTLMFYLMIFGGLLILYSLIRFVYPIISANTVRKEIIKENIIGVGMGTKTSDKIPTEIIAKTNDNIHYTFILQRVDTTDPLRNKQLKIIIKNNIITRMTDQEGKVILNLSEYFPRGEEKKFYVEFSGDDYFKYSRYEFKEM